MKLLSASLPIVSVLVLLASKQYETLVFATNNSNLCPFVALSVYLFYFLVRVWKLFICVMY